MSKRCDGVIDCEDKSDEIACDKYVTGPAYIQSLPPPQINGGI